jgi:hypothetical protein
MDDLADWAGQGGLQQGRRHARPAFALTGTNMQNTVQHIFIL